MATLYDGNGNPIPIDGSSGNLESAFFCEKLCIAPNQKTQFYGDGLYCQNPASFSTDTAAIYFYDSNNSLMFLHDENGDPAPSTRQHGTLGSVPLQNRETMEFDGTKVTFKLYLSLSAFNANQPTNVWTYWFDEVPTYIRSNRALSYEILSTEQIPSDMLFTRYEKENSRGFLEQINNEVAESEMSSLDTRDEYVRRFRTEVIRETNRTRHAFRIGSFNVARYGQAHWYMIKECLQNYGLDICGLQEVTYPLGDDPAVSNPYTKKLSEEFLSWQFNSFSTNGASGDFPNSTTHDYATNVRSMMAGNGFEVVTSVEYQFQSQGGSNWDWRYVEKCELSIPRYKDKRGSENLKLSIYNTQLELSKSYNLAQAQEILAMVQDDPNPFIIIMGDTNDFTLGKETWTVFEEAGFTHVINTNTSTVAGTEDFNCLDNFFVSSRISALDWNVVWAQDWPWKSAGGVQPMLSDHDLVYADLALDYSDIRCVNLFLTNCSTTWTRGWLSDSETVTFTITPDEGYALPVSPNKMLDCMIANPEALSYSNGTVTIDGSKLIGDVYIKIAATATT